MEENKEMSLVAKKAKLLEFQNQISWIASEYAKMERTTDHYTYSRERNLRIAMYENLNSIVSQIKFFRLQDYLSDAYKEMINGLQISLRCNIDDLGLSIVQKL